MRPESWTWSTALGLCLLVSPVMCTDELFHASFDVSISVGLAVVGLGQVELATSTAWMERFPSMLWWKLLINIAAQRRLRETPDQLRIMQADGCEVTGLREYEGSRVYVVHAPPRPRIRFRLRLILGPKHTHQHTFSVNNDGINCAGDAERICAFNDTCTNLYITPEAVSQIVCETSRLEQQAPVYIREATLFVLKHHLGPQYYQPRVASEDMPCTLCKLKKAKCADTLDTAHTVLFVDDHAICSMTNLSRLFETAAKVQVTPVMTRDRPWESKTSPINPCVLHDGHSFKMYYRPWNQGLAYAESKDGIIWEKPNIGIYDLYEHLFDRTSRLPDLVKANKENFLQDASRQCQNKLNSRVRCINPVERLDKTQIPTNNNVLWSEALSNSPDAPHFGQNGNPVNVIFDPDDEDPDKRYKALHECRKPPGCLVSSTVS